MKKHPTITLLPARSLDTAGTRAATGGGLSYNTTYTSRGTGARRYEEADGRPTYEATTTPPERAKGPMPWERTQGQDKSTSTRPDFYLSHSQGDYVRNEPRR
jgi:hypothetical protein